MDLPLFVADPSSDIFLSVLAMVHREMSQGIELKSRDSFDNDFVPTLYVVKLHIPYNMFCSA